MTRLTTFAVAAMLGGGLITGIAGTAAAVPIVQSAAVDKLEKKVQKEVEEAADTHWRAEANDVPVSLTALVWTTSMPIIVRMDIRAGTK